MTYDKFKKILSKITDAVFIFSSVSPALWLSLLYLYALRARFVLGYWPRPYNPDPKDLIYAIGFHYKMVWASGNAPFILFFVALTIIPFWKFLNPKARLIPRLSILGAAWIVTMTLFCIDPGNFIEWYFD